MSGIKKRYYWDACVYIAWLNQESSKAPWLPAINEIVAANKRRDNLIITSVLTLMEVLESRLTPEQEKDFQNCFHFGTHERYDVDIPVVMRARRYRDHYLANKVDGKVLTTPDAIHLATGFIHNVDEFHTFDDGKSGKGCSLLALDGNVAGDALKVCRPEMDLATPLELVF